MCDRIPVYWEELSNRIYIWGARFPAMLLTVHMFMYVCSCEFPRCLYLVPAVPALGTFRLD